MLLPLLFATGASAQDSGPDDLEPPPPMVKLERLPPRYSFELAIQMSYGDITYYRDEVPWWGGWGLRGGYGKNSGKHRIGVGIGAGIEGPMPVHYTAALEPVAQWDYIADNHFAIGASVGPALLLHSKIESQKSATNFGVAPAAAVRIGGSQTWSRVGRRIFAYIEPKLRIMYDGADWQPNPVFSLVVGQGQGR